MQTVSFVNMADGTPADYELLDTLERAYVAGLPLRIILCAGSVGILLQRVSGFATGALATVRNPGLQRWPGQRIHRGCLAS